MKQQDIAEQAAEWIEQVRSGRASSAALLAWLRESPRHVEEVLFISSVEGALADFGARRGDEVEALLRSGPTRKTPVIPLDRAQRPHSATSFRPMRRWWVAGLAAAALLASILLFKVANPEQDYTTHIGEQRTLELEDGSLVYLNTDSKLTVRITRDARDINLIQGEALFDVERDPARPFRVHTAEAAIQAVGTQFNVYRRGGSTRVAVLEGRVKVLGDKTLDAGEEIRVSSGGQVTQPAPADLPRVVAWRQRRLVFHDDTLAGIASEFNRYNRRKSIQVDDDIKQRRFTGTFNADAPESLARALAADTSLVVEMNGGGIRVRMREPL